MKLNSKISFGLIFLGALVWAGCQTTQYPSSYLSSTGPNPALVADFDGGLLVNSSLAEADKPGNHVQVAGPILLGTYDSSVVTLAPSVLSLGAPGYNGVGQSAHVTGSFHDAANGKYPALSLEIALEAANKYYDASLFTGVKFYIMVASADVAALRSFSIPIGLTTVAASGGICDQPPFTSASNPCYNSFGTSFTNTNGIWKPVVLTFASLTRGNYGPTISPATLSGTNLQQILMLDWSEGNSNAAGDVNVDFSVDQVEFF